MLEAESRGADHLVDPRGRIQHVGAVLEDGDDRAVTDDRGELTLRRVVDVELDVVPGSVDQTVSDDGVGDPKVRVIERRRKHIAQPAWWRGVAEICYHPCHARPRPTRLDPLEGDAARDRHEKGRLEQLEQVGQAVGWYCAPTRCAPEPDGDHKGEDSARHEEEALEPPAGRALPNELIARTHPAATDQMAPAIVPMATIPSASAIEG